MHGGSGTIIMSHHQPDQVRKNVEGSKNMLMSGCSKNLLIIEACNFVYFSLKYLYKALSSYLSSVQAPCVSQPNEKVLNDDVVCLT